MDALESAQKAKTVAIADLAKVCEMVANIDRHEYIYITHLILQAQRCFITLEPTH